MTSAHPQYNYNRRNSASAPYTVPPKHHHHKHTHSHSHSHSHTPSHTPSHTGQAGFQPLSRDFVVRRISEGETGRLKEELKCESCGKGYKHISSLAKHLWEHTPEWNVTKKLLLSKHQQVQLLEAASILVGMNEPTGAAVPAAHKNATGASSRRNSEYFSPISEDDDYEQVVSSDTSYTPMNSIDKGKESTEAAQIKRFSTGYENTSIKSRRAGSVSQYPPSYLSGKKEVNEPGVHSTFEGGYLDTNAEDDSNNDNKKARSLSIVLNHDSRHRMEDSGLASPDSRMTYVDTPLHPPVFSPSPSASTHSSPKTEAQESGSLENSIDEIVN
ncbi:hypothetical protein CLIB1423_04S07558 [[Candida] railenensis]|uniref:C2H2-type domain-containing protein n=1 Tax=[Candida] railenensis TaxID=45579 RepID=A0A9P0VXT0_9ASCO|nr:hypothetical protein CLIB1423_04S07558 [[Candida] railenensis]